MCITRSIICFCALSCDAPPHLPVASGPLPVNECLLSHLDRREASLSILTHYFIWCVTSSFHANHAYNMVCAEFLSGPRILSLLSSPSQLTADTTPVTD